MTDAPRCGTCKWWENEYRNSRIVKNTMGACHKNVDMDKLPRAFIDGWNGWVAVDKTDGTDCPCYERKSRE